MSVRRLMRDGRLVLADGRVPKRQVRAQTDNSQQLMSHSENVILKFS